MLTSTAINLFLDIETLPTIDEAVIADISARVKPPGSMSKAETIAKWEAEQKPGAVAEAVSRTSLDGAYGRICCVGWALGDDDAYAYLANEHVIPEAPFQACGEIDERGMLSSFFDDVSGFVCSSPVRVVGHNVVNFDLRLIVQRAIVLGVKIPKWLPIAPKPWDASVLDTMVAWAGQRDHIGLDRLSKALGLPGKGDFTGADVAGAWARGEYDRIASYCADDVRKVRDVACAADNAEASSARRPSVAAKGLDGGSAGRAARR